MASRIADTLDIVAALRSPVVRSCHVGNNTSNVWGWLALAGNARLVQYDHTLYGLDENCIPWVVLGDSGRVDASFGIDGLPKDVDTGRHVNDVIGGIDLKHTSHLNYALFASYNGQDLLLHHVRVAQRLCDLANGSISSFDSREVLRNKDLFANVIRSFAASGCLMLMFDRWVRTTRKGHVIMRRLRTIGTDRETVEAIDIDDSLVFRGTVQELTEALFQGLAAVADRLATAAPLPSVNYPWFTLPFAYLANCLQEHVVDAQQRVFWHAGGSASQYYINEETMQASFDALFHSLGSHGFLPEHSTLRMIPTFCCQLFATTDAGAESLSDMLTIWQEYLARYRCSVVPYLEGLGGTTDPFGLVDAYAKQLPRETSDHLLEQARRFNRGDVNQVPVAHVVGKRHANYNKYGVAQHRLLAVHEFRIPSALRDLTWSEAELLVKTLAHLTLDERG